MPAFQPAHAQLKEAEMPVPCCPIIKQPPIAAFDDPAAAADQPQIRQRQHDQQPRQPLPILEPGLIEVKAPIVFRIK